MLDPWRSRYSSYGMRDKLVFWAPNNELTETYFVMMALNVCCIWRHVNFVECHRECDDYEGEWLIRSVSLSQWEDTRPIPNAKTTWADHMDINKSTLNMISSVSLIIWSYKVLHLLLFYAIFFYIWYNIPSMRFYTHSLPYQLFKCIYIWVMHL